MGAVMEVRGNMTECMGGKEGRGDEALGVKVITLSWKLLETRKCRKCLLMCYLRGLECGGLCTQEIRILIDVNKRDGN